MRMYHICVRAERASRLGSVGDLREYLGEAHQ